MCAIFGFAQTAVLGIALAIQCAESLNFDAIYTPAVYTPHLVNTAFAVLLSCSSIYYGLVCWLAPKQTWVWRAPDKGEIAFAKLVRNLSLPAGILLLALTSLGIDIRQVAYGAQDSQGNPIVQSSGLQLIALFLLAFALVSTARVFRLRSFQFIIVATIVVSCIAYFLTMHGDRSGTLVILTTLGFLFWFDAKNKTATKCLVLLIYCAAVFEFYQLWAFVRWNAVFYGLVGAIQEYFNTSSNSASRGAFDPLAVQLLPQSYWQLLHSIDLYQNGVALGLRRFFDLIPQSIPQFISDYFGYERPINGAWLLSQYRITSGGFFVIAEAYWNSGVWGSLATSAALAGIAIGLERWYRRQSPLFSMTYLPIAGSFGFMLFYGMQPLVKALEVSLCLGMGLKWLRRQYSLRATANFGGRSYAPASSR
ncbi:MAG: hypothetical protein JOY62_03680 [Acidobacteriaceae bacterium]|nr:hypothetical protein [Acidobacteriaceae bacterium]MBV9779052.1 hypothetical protein [Acidobacteriaceae bacterium]